MRISRKLKLVAAVSTVAAIVAVPAWGAGDKSAETVTTAAPQITVNGSGSVSATPDIAVWTFSLTTRAASARDALRGNANEMRKVIAALKAAGIKAADLRTAQVSLGARSNSDGTAVIGYDASNSVTARVRQAASTGDIVDAAVEAGADGVNGPQFQVANENAVYRQALQAAFADAKAKATRLAQAGGLSLGKAITIVEQSASQPVFYGATMAKAAALDSTPVEAGSSEITATISVTFALV